MLRVYQPLSGMTRPVVVDPGDENLAGLRVDVKCIEGDLVSRREASNLCRKVSTLFENQGASVKLTTAGPARFGETRDEDAALGPADLQVELSSRKIEKISRPLSVVLMYVTFGILPTISEQTFAQDLEIRDGTGFLLAQASFEGRIVERFGFGPWVGNKLLDWAWREPEEELTGDAFERNLSEDLYRQLSQEMFNASIQAEILREQVAGPPQVVQEEVVETVQVQGGSAPAIVEEPASLPGGVPVPAGGVPAEASN